MEEHLVKVGSCSGNIWVQCPADAHSGFEAQGGDFPGAPAPNPGVLSHLGFLIDIAQSGFSGTGSHILPFPTAFWGPRSLGCHDAPRVCEPDVWGEARRPFVQPLLLFSSEGKVP